MARLDGRFVSSLDDEAALQVRGQAVHKAGADHRMLRQLFGQASQENVALVRVDRRLSLIHI